MILTEADTLDSPDLLPPTLSLLAAAQMLGVGRTAAYELVRSGQWPTRVLRLGRSIRIPTAPLLAELGLTDRPTGLQRLEGQPRAVPLPSPPGDHDGVVPQNLP